MELLVKTAEGFDRESACKKEARVNGSYHDAYVDGQGNHCLVCISKKVNGGVAVGVSALEWLQTQEGGRFVRLYSLGAGMDVIVAVEELPQKTPLVGHLGNFVIYDRQDFTPGEFLPTLSESDVPF